MTTTIMLGMPIMMVVTTIVAVPRHQRCRRPTRGLPNYWKPPPSDVDCGGFAGTADGGVGTLAVPRTVVGWVDGAGGVDGLGGTAAAGAGSRRDATGVMGAGGEVVGAAGVAGRSMAGKPTGRTAIGVAAARGEASVGAAIAALGEAFLAAVARVGLTGCGRAFVVRRTVVFAAGFAAFVIRAGGRFAAAALPIIFLALIGCLVDRVATAALLVFLAILATRLGGRLAFVARTAFFVLAAALATAGFDFAGFAGRLAAVARPDDFAALLFLETARAIEPSPSEHHRRRRRRPS